MIIKEKKQFIDFIKSFSIRAKYVIIKPNWVDNKEGNYTEPEVLEWLFEALPQRKIVIESYTPWRGKEYKGGRLGVGLDDGKEFWEFYKAMDEEYLKKTGIAEILDKFGCRYINATNEYWNGNMVDSSLVKSLVESKYGKVHWTEFYSFVPKEIYDIRKEAAFISLAKIKTEEENRNIIVSLSSKNIFGLIPHPSRRDPYHKDNHKLIPQAILDINKIYMSVFENSLWINEGIKSIVRHYCESNQYYEKNKGLVFAGHNPVEVDIETCREFGIEPQKVPYLKAAKSILA